MTLAIRTLVRTTTGDLLVDLTTKSKQSFARNRWAVEVEVVSPEKRMIDRCLQSQRSLHSDQ